MCLKRSLLIWALIAGLGISAASSWGQASPSDTSTSAPEAPVAPSLQPKLSMLETAQSSLDDSTTLRQRLELRKTQAEAQVESWRTIVASLKLENETAKRESTDLSDRLAKAEAELQTSQTALMEISILLDASKAASASLSTDFATYKVEAGRGIRAGRLKSGLWRAFGLSGALGLAGSLAGPALGTDALHGAAWGAGVGAAGGGVWLVVELWPLKIKLPLESIP